VTAAAKSESKMDALQKKKCMRLRIKCAEADKTPEDVAEMKQSEQDGCRS
jgi:hypothetical protein